MMSRRPIIGQRQNLDHNTALSITTLLERNTLMEYIFMPDV